jgi:hypothetical protein
VHQWLETIVQGDQIVKNGKTTYTGSWISLHFDTPALGGTTAAEIGGGGYQRFKMKWSNPDNRAVWSVIDARFTGLVQTKVTYFGVWNKQNKGRLMAYTELQAPVAILNGKGFVIPAYQIVVSMG